MTGVEGVAVAMQAAAAFNASIQGVRTIFGGEWTGPEIFKVSSTAAVSTFDEKIAKDEGWLIESVARYRLPFAVMRHAKLRTLKGAVGMVPGEVVGATQFARGRRKAKVVGTGKEREFLDRVNIELNKKKVKLRAPLQVVCEVVRFQKTPGGQGAGRVDWYHLRNVTITSWPSYKYKLKNKYHETSTLSFAAAPYAVAESTESYVTISWSWSSDGRLPFSIKGTTNGELEVRIGSDHTPRLVLLEGNSRKLIKPQPISEGETVEGSQVPSPGKVGPALQSVAVSGMEVRPGKWEPDPSAVKRAFRAYIRSRIGVGADLIEEETFVNSVFREAKPTEWLIFFAQRGYPLDDDLRDRLDTVMKAKSVRASEIARRLDGVLEKSIEEFSKVRTKNLDQVTADPIKARELAKKTDWLILSLFDERADAKRRGQLPEVARVDRELIKVAKAGTVGVLKTLNGWSHRTASARVEELVKRADEVDLFYEMILDKLALESEGQIPTWGNRDPEEPLDSAESKGKDKVADEGQSGNGDDGDYEEKLAVAIDSINAWCVTVAQDTDYPVDERRDAIGKYLVTVMQQLVEDRDKRSAKAAARFVARYVDQAKGDRVRAFNTFLSRYLKVPQQLKVDFLSSDLT